MTDPFLRNCLEDRPGAWEALWSRYGPLIRRAAAARLGNEADAEEVSQKVFLKLKTDNGRALRSFRGDCALGTWLVVMTLGEATDHARSEERLRRHLHRRLVEGASVPTPLQAICTTEDIERVRAAMAELPPRDRLLLTLIYWDGASHAQAAGLLKIPVHSVTHFLNAAQARLRNRLSA